MPFVTFEVVVLDWASDVVAVVYEGVSNVALLFECLPKTCVCQNDETVMIYMYPKSLLDNLLNLFICLSLVLLCLSSLILLMGKMHCVSLLPWIKFLSLE